jgi:hypothetical protein
VLIGMPESTAGEGLSRRDVACHSVDLRSLPRAILRYVVW